VIDGALRAARAIGAGTVYFYVSDPAAAVSLDTAIAELDGLGVALRVFQVEPSYVAGEETAAVNALNGRPAKPSEKPPRPFEEGVRGLPTLVSNAETIANLPAIAAGDERAATTFLLTLGGAVPRPGLYEVPFGVTVGEALETLGGLAGRPKGYVMGGYFAGVLGARGHALPLDYDALRAEGTGLGCGAVTVLGPGDCPVGAAALLLAYFGRENAGQCGSCFNGTAAMAGVAAALARGEAGSADVQRLETWAGFLPGRGACATLDGAAGIAATLLREFADEVESHRVRSCAACEANTVKKWTVRCVCVGVA
jgi:NADH:ubiquinone oxidoreductase subunit F (NADH-binding)